MSTAISLRTCVMISAVIIVTDCCVDKDISYHVFASFHELLVDYLARIVYPCLDVDGLLDDGISPTSQSPARAILGSASGETTNQYRERENRNLARNGGGHC